MCPAFYVQALSDTAPRIRKMLYVAIVDTSAEALDRVQTIVGPSMEVTIAAQIVSQATIDGMRMHDGQVKLVYG